MLGTLRVLEQHLALLRKLIGTLIALEEARLESDSLFQGISPRPNEKQEILTVKTTATDDQLLEQIWNIADRDKVTVGDTGELLTLTFQDPDGNDISRWITATPDAANPLLFRYSRNSNDDGTQPAELDFFVIGSTVVDGEPVTFKAPGEMGFTPGAPALITATAATVITPPPAATTPAPAAPAATTPAPAAPAAPAVGDTVPAPSVPGDPTSPPADHTVTAVNPDGTVQAVPVSGGPEVTVDPATLTVDPATLTVDPATLTVDPATLPAAASS